MAATDLFLIRNGTFQYAKYTAVLQLDVTGARQVYSSVTGNNATDVITIAGNTLQNDFPVYFQALSGGAGLSVNTTYWVINTSGNTFKLSLTKGGSAVNFTTDITAATLIYSNSEIFVWSPAYRDVFDGLGTQQGSGVVQTGGNSAVQYGAPQGYGIAADPDQALTLATITLSGVTQAYVNGAPKVFISDDVAHKDLRQTATKRTYWRFDFGASATPRYAYAEIMNGDIIANSPPNTP